MGDLWKISSGGFSRDRESIMRNGNIFQISNGYMGYRGTLDEFTKEHLVGITLAGIFDKVGESWREPVNAPNGAYTKLLVDGKEISVQHAEIIEHTQDLFLQNASYVRNTLFQAGDNRVRICSSRFLSADSPNLMLVEYSFTLEKDAQVRLLTGIDYDIWDLNGPHLVNFVPGKEDAVLTLHAHTHELGKEISIAEIIDYEVGKEQHCDEKSKNLRSVEIDARGGKTYKFYKYIAVVKEDDPGVDQVKNASIRMVSAARNEGFESCRARHTARWSEKWNQCDVVIEGDDEAQLALRYSIFQLLMVAPVPGSGNSIPARALSGQVYKGAIFWDTEMFMFPFFLYTYPEIARELMHYRIKTLDGARRKARTEGVGYRGAFYAWESQETGDDACTYFNVGDPTTHRELRTHFRDKQVHISGDVAVAMWEYFRITGDDSLLRNGGAEVILECARFYYSYSWFKPEKDRYEILDVIGPDEYHERVNNNIFTNKIAEATFDAALGTISYLKDNYPEELSAIVEKLRIEDEIPLFKQFRKKLYIPQPDPKTGIIEQFDTYFKLEDASVEEVRGRKIHPDEYMGAGQGVAVPTQVIKQADVVMMLNLFKEQYSSEVKTANWEYYEPRTEHGSSLSSCAYALVAADIGKTDWAYTYFLKTAKLDLEAKYKVWVGTIFMGGSHPAANGGAWMAAILGFAGVKADENRLYIHPRLYPKWKSLSFKLSYKLDSYSVCITPQKVRIRASSKNAAQGIISVAGIEYTCEPDTEIEAYYRNAKKENLKI